MARACDASRFVILLVGAAAVEWDAPGATVYAVGAVAMVATTAYYPARTTLVPLLSRTVEEAAAANAVSSLAKSAGALVGPLVAGVLLATGSIPAALVCAGLMHLAAAVCVPAVQAGVESLRRAGGRLRAEVTRGSPPPGPSRRRALPVPVRRQDLGRAGSSVFRGGPAARPVRRRRGRRRILSAAVGVGGILGAFAAAGFAERHGMAEPMSSAWRCSAWPSRRSPWRRRFALALVCLVANGLGNSVGLDTSGYTLLSRSVHDDVLGRISGWSDAAHGFGGDRVRPGAPRPSA